MKRLSLLVLVALLLAAAASLAALPVGGEIAVNTTTTSTQEDPAIAIDGSGAFTVAWQSDNGGQDEIGLRRFAADGTPLSSEVLFGNADDEDDVAVATAANGNGVVVYDADTAADGEEVRAKLFAASPFSVGATEIEVNTETAGNQEQAAVAMDADGDFVVAWVNPDNEENGDGVNAQRYDETGAPQGGEIEVNTGVTDNQDRPSVAMDAAGNFVIAWESDAQDDVDSSDGVYAQRFDAAGAPQGGEMAVNQTTAANQRRPAVAMDADGDFAIVWQGNGPDDADGVFFRRYDAAGAPVTGELRANETVLGSQGDRPAVAMDSDGDFAVAWDGNGPGDADGVFVRDFTATGAPLAGELLVNSSTAELQTRSVVVADPDGDMVVAWHSGALGATDVFARRFTRPPVPPVPPVVCAPCPGPGPTGPVISGLKLTANPKGVSASVLCLAALCNVRGTGSVLVPNRALAAKTFSLRSARRTLTQGQRGKFNLKLTPKARKAVVRALKQRRYRRKVKASVKVTGTATGRAPTSLRKTARFRPAT